MQRSFLARSAKRLKTITNSAVSLPFKRAHFGLYDGVKITFGNNKPKSLQKTRRNWLPNVHHKRLYSDALGRDVTLGPAEGPQAGLKVSARALRSIDKCGGLDNYLLKMKNETLGALGIGLREWIRQAKQAGTEEARLKIASRAQSKTALFKRGLELMRGTAIEQVSTLK